MNSVENDLTVLVPEFPQTPKIEIPRDGLVKRVFESFGPDCQKQVIVSDDYYGKTNFLAQFCRQYPSSSISYFITSNPITQNYRNFLFVICNQISKIVKGESLQENISEVNLRNLFLGLSVKLSDYARQNKKIFYFVIDGLEFALNNDFGLDIVMSPPTTAKLSPYLLYSASKKTLEKLPEQYKCNVKSNEFEAAFQFNFNNTEKYLEGLELTTKDSKYIHDKSKGIVGYLAVVRDSIKTSGKEWIYEEELPDSLHRLIQNQVEHVFLEVNPLVRSIIEIVSVSPKPINIRYLNEYFGQDIPINEITKTELLVENKDNKTITLKNDLAKSIINEKLGEKKKELEKSLLGVIQRNPEIDSELLTILLEELNDYHGLVSLVKTNEIKKAIDTGNANIVLSRLKAIIKLSSQEENLDEMSKWGWLLSSTKEFLTQTSTTSEINALISIGDSSQAIEMSYNFPEDITKINLLANIYTKMKERHEHVSKNALDELELMINELNIENYDKEMVKSLALNLFMLFPEKAMLILDNVIGNKSAIDAAFSKNNSDLKNNASTEFIDGNDASVFLDLFNMSSSWLKKFTFVNLLQEIEDLNATRVKEYLIRQWCMQKETDEELALGIELWLDTIISDEKYVISLRNLRKISELLPNLIVEDRRRLKKRLQISSILSLRTPWQEWVGFRLNLAESSYDYDMNSSKEEIEDVYRIVNTQIEDLDIKVFCYTKLWGTYKKLRFLGEQDIKDNLERVVSALLANSAMQDEIFINTLRSLARIDIDYALEIAGRLNTKERRIQAKRIVLITGYKAQSQKDYSSQLKDTLQDLDSYYQEILLFELIKAISEKELTIDNESQKILFLKSRSIKNQIIKSITLVNLASIWTREDIVKISKLLQEAEDSWKNENDLKNKIILGYMMVETIAKIDVSLAREFYNTVQSTQLFAGAELAIGGLGSIFTHSLDFAIRSLDNLNILNEENIEIICDQIRKLPTTFIQQQLYAQLAAKLFRIGNNKKAEDVVQEKILINLTNIKDQFLREKIIYFSLPVIFWYSQNEAKKLSSELPTHQMNKCWFSVILWTLGNGQIGDVHDFDVFKVPSNTNTIRDKALVAFEQISEDSFIDAAVRVLTQSIEYSFTANKLDTINAFDILISIEQYVTKNLPDKNNIEHIGYKITALSRINCAKGQIYNYSRRKINFNQVDIRKKWTELEHLAKSEIKNAADRVYVLTILAREMHSWDKDKAEILLDSLSENEIRKIPALVDRVNRIELIAKTWGLWGQEKQAQYLFNLLANLINEFSPYEQDAKLEQAIQAAYDISPQFAEEIAEKLNSRFYETGIRNYKKRLQELQYSGDLRKLISDSRDKQSNLQGGVIVASTERLLNALLNDNGTIPTTNVLLETLYLSTNYDPEVIITVLKLILECENRQGTQIKSNYFTNFIESSKFTHNLAKWISPITQKGLSPNIIDILPGLSSKVHTFEIGQRKKAEDWVKHWINQNTEKFIKICDPYFGPHEITFVSDIQKNILIWVITTDEKFKRKDDIKNEILESWRKLGKGNNPPMRFYIVPSKLHETFHDRAIVTDKGGLNVGPSLNGLGNKRHNITELEFNEAKELEKQYIDNMLSQVRWSTDYSILPKFIAID